MTISKLFGVLRDPVGVALPGRPLTVYATGTTALASLFEDDGSTVIPNPFNTDSLGNWSFNVAQGSYDINFNIDSVTTQSLTNIPTSAPSGGGGGSSIPFSPVDTNVNGQSGSATFNASGYTTGQIFVPIASGIEITGVRFYWGGGTDTVICELWDKTGTLKASATAVAVTAPGIYTATFTSSYTTVTADIGNNFTVSTYAPSGYTDWNPGKDFAGYNANGYYWLATSCYSPGTSHAYPSSNNTAATYFFCCEPIIA
jgi:hypothetical protein